MKILIDGGMQVEAGTGIGKYTKYLFDTLRVHKVQVEMDNYRCGKGSKIYQRLNYMRYINSMKYRKKCRQYGIIHYTNYLIPFLRNSSCRYIVTVHDLASYLHGDTLSALYRRYNQFVIKHAVKNSDRVITVSHAVKDEISKLFPEYKDKITVIYPGHYDEIKHQAVNTVYENERLKNIRPDKFFLFIGTLEKRKNIGMILQAFFMLKQCDAAARDYQLVLAGRPGYGFETFAEMIKDSEFGSDVILPGYISETDCALLYRQAAAYIFASVYEGFGSPQLECMECETPLILSNIPTNREISKDYGLFFDLNDTGQLIEQMKKIIHNQYDDSGHQIIARERIKGFRWNQIIKEFIDVYTGE